MDEGAAAAVEVEVEVELAKATALGVADAWTVEAAAAALPALFLLDKWKILLTIWPMERKWTMTKDCPRRRNVRPDEEERKERETIDTNE